MSSIFLQTHDAKTTARLDGTQTQKKCLVNVYSKITESNFGVIRNDEILADGIFNF
jgi:hypothetical protein